MSKRMSSTEVAALLREIALDYRQGSPEDRALTIAADALEETSVVEIGTGRGQAVRHPEQEIPVGMGLDIYLE